MIAAHVIIFGSGPRLRSICAALVRDCNVDVHILMVESREAGALRAAAYRTQVIFLDARVAVEAACFVEFIRDSRDVIIASAIGWNGEPSVQPAAVKTREPFSIAALDSRLTLTGSRPNIGSWLELSYEPERRSSELPPVRCHSYGWGFSGYASLSRHLMIGLEDVGVDVAWSADFAEDESVDMNERDRRKLAAMNIRRRANETPIIFHAPTFTDGRPFLGPLCRIFNIHSPISITMFETDRVPARWSEQLSLCEQVWVPASFNVESFVAGGVPREKLCVVPMGLDFEHSPVDGPRLEIPYARGFTFLAVSEWTYRKGFDVLLAAYASAFARDDDVSLVIRSHYAGVDVAAEIRRSLKVLGFTPELLAPILLLPQKLTTRDFSALYRGAGAFVLPTRGEGFGVPCLEAMALGIPTISTGWGGSTDFLNVRTGFPISATLKPVPRRDCIQFPIFTGQQWAEPSVESTATAMRFAFDHREEAQVVAARGAALVRTKYNRETTARHALQMLREYRPRAVSKHNATGAVTLVGDVLSANGSGAAARSVMRGLVLNGLRVEARTPFASHGVSAVRSDEGAFVKVRLGHEVVGQNITIVYSKLADVGRLAVGASTVILTVADENVSDANAIAALKRANIVCVASASCAAILERNGVDWRRLRIVPACIDTDFWTPEIGGQQSPSSGAFAFVSLMDWDRDDGWETLVTAFAAAFNAGDGVTLALSIAKQGEPDSGFGEKCVQEISSLLAARFPQRSRLKDLPLINLRLGKLAEEDLAIYFGSHDAFVLVPRTRRSGRTFLQAMACGLPTIAPRAGPHLAFMNDENSYLVDVERAGLVEEMDLRWDVRLDYLTATLRRVVNRSKERAEKSHLARSGIVANNGLAEASASLRAIIDEEQALLLTKIAAQEPLTRKLSIFVTTAGEEMADLEQCLDCLSRNTTSRNVSVTIRSEKSTLLTRRNGQIAVIGMSVDEMVATIEEASHVAFVNDDVRVGPGWDSLLIDALDSRVEAVVALPQSNGEKVGRVQGKSELGYDPATLIDFDNVVIARETRMIGRGQYASMIFPFCSVIEARALKRVAESNDADCMQLSDLLRHVLVAHPRVWFAHDVWVHNGGSAAKPLGVIRMPPSSLIAPVGRV